MASTESTSGSFQFPKEYNFPPFFTRQPTALTRQSQFRKWSSLIQSYCRHGKIFQLSVVDMAEQPLFNNARLKKKFAVNDIKEVIDYMATKDGDERAEWLSPARAVAWIWWRKPEEWGNRIASWVEETGQKGIVLTLYEIVEGDTTENQEFHGMSMELLNKSLGVLVKKGKCQVFGTDDQQGVKFF